MASSFFRWFQRRRRSQAIGISNSAARPIEPPPPPPLPDVVVGWEGWTGCGVGSGMGAGSSFVVIPISAASSVEARPAMVLFILMISARIESTAYLPSKRTRIVQSWPGFSSTLQLLAIPGAVVTRSLRVALNMVRLTSLYSAQRLWFAGTFSPRSGVTVIPHLILLFSVLDGDRPF